MATTYCTVADVADFLRVPITATTTPNKTQVEKIINRKEEELDRRIGHTFGRSKQVVNENHDLPLLYNYGWGTPIYLHHRNIRELDSAQGDKIEVWQGTGSEWEDILNNDQWYEYEPVYGKIFLRGFLFSIMRKYRIRITYRYGDTTVPDDIKDACIKLTARDILTTSFRMDQLPIGGSGGMSWNEMIEYWEEDINRCVDNRKEVFIIP